MHIQGDHLELSWYCTLIYFLTWALPCNITTLIWDLAVFKLQISHHHSYSCRDVHCICITVATYSGYRYESALWALLMTQNTAILIWLKYSCWGNGRGLFNVIEVSNYDLNEANYTYILMTAICCCHETIHIWTTVWTWYRFDIRHTTPWARYFV